MLGAKAWATFAAADEVDPEDAVPVARLEVPEREAELARADPRGEDDVIAPAEIAADLLGDAADRRRSRSRRRRRRKPWPARSRRSLGDARAVGVAVDDRDVRPLGDERRGDRPADPLRPAHHDGDVARQLKIHWKDQPIGWVEPGEAHHPLIRSWGWPRLDPPYKSK